MALVPMADSVMAVPEVIQVNLIVKFNKHPMKQFSIILFFAISHGNTLLSQVYTSPHGSFILFDKAVRMDVEYTVLSDPIKNESYHWPGNANEFIRRYREAQATFGEPVPMTDEMLIKLFASMEEHRGQGNALQMHPTTMLALGSAAFIKNDKTIKSVLVDKKDANKQRETFTLESVDHLLTGRAAKISQKQQDGTDIQFVVAFPGDSWIDSARVTKQVVGSDIASIIKPILLTTSLGDKTVMQVWDTSKVVGEFIYVIQPHDKLDNWHPALPGVYAHNYTQHTEPRITEFEAIAMKESKSISLSWNVTYSERVRGFNIYRAACQDGTFLPIGTVPVTEKTYTDHVKGTMQEYFYYVQVIDQMGPGARSITKFVVPSFHEKPAPPVAVGATSIQGGIQVLWSTHDPFYHVQGYYVFRKPPGNHAWEQISPFLMRAGEQMTWTDTSRFLDPNVEYVYAVKSESSSYIHSDLSAPAYARPQIKRELTTPGVVNKRTLDGGQHMLYWEDMRLHEPYIAFYHLFESDATGKIGKEVTGSPFDDEQLTWIIPTGQPVASGYVLQIEDAWGNRSAYSSIVQTNTVVNNPSPARLLARPAPGGYILQWASISSPMVKSIELYKVNADGKRTLAKSLKPATTSFVLSDMKAGQTEMMYITYKFEDGSESERSEMVILQ
jgi:hypothetical protein